MSRYRLTGWRTPLGFTRKLPLGTSPPSLPSSSDEELGKGLVGKRQCKDPALRYRASSEVVASDRLARLLTLQVPVFFAYTPSGWKSCLFFLHDQAAFPFYSSLNWIGAQIYGQPADYPIASGRAGPFFVIGWGAPRQLHIPGWGEDSRSPCGAGGRRPNSRALRKQLPRPLRKTQRAGTFHGISFRRSEARAQLSNVAPNSLLFYGRDGGQPDEASMSTKTRECENPMSRSPVY